MHNKEQFYSSFRNFGDNDLSSYAEISSLQKKYFNFFMNCNGYKSTDGKWDLDSNLTFQIENELRPLETSFFGPSGERKPFFNAKKYISPEIFQYVFSQPSVMDVIKRYHESNKDLSKHIAFILGGLIRHFDSFNTKITKEDIARNVEFVAKMTKLADEGSAEAVVDTMSMYVISGGSIADDQHFSTNIAYMAEAVSQDPIELYETKDLGLSQLARLRYFVNRLQYKEDDSLSEIYKYDKFFNNFPTVGAEFHFPLNASHQYPNFWQRLALLNLSQHQKNSYIQLSRNDRNVIEVRMNPSIYPVTVANWEHMRLLLPELNHAYFTITFNRQREKGDFSWNDVDDTEILSDITGVGLLCYAGMFENIPLSSKGEINFGSIYLGQTVRIEDGYYEYTGSWSGSQHDSGQVGVFAGFGNNFYHLAYYLSMIIAKPEITSCINKNVLKKANSLKGAFDISNADKKAIFHALQYKIEEDKELSRAYNAGNTIFGLLRP